MQTHILVSRAFCIIHLMVTAPRALAVKILAFATIFKKAVNELHNQTAHPMSFAVPFKRVYADIGLEKSNKISEEF